MTCIEVRRWLDEGGSERERSRANAHAGTCVHCEREVRAAAEVERLLAIVVPAVIGAAFNDAVMRRLHARNRWRPWRRTLDAVVQILAEPIVPLSLAIAAATTWHAGTLATSLAGASNRVVLAIDHLLTSNASSTHPDVTVSIALTLAPILFWISWRLFRTYEHLAMPGY